MMSLVIATYKYAEDTLVSIDLAYLSTIDQRRDVPHQGSWCQSILRRCLGKHCNGYLRHQYLRFNFQGGHPFDRLDLSRHFGRNGSQSIHVWTINAHDDGRTRSRQNFLDSLFEVSQQISVQSGVAIDDALYLGNSCVVVLRFIDADPKLGKIRTDDFIRNCRAPDV